MILPQERAGIPSHRRGPEEGMLFQSRREEARMASWRRGHLNWTHLGGWEDTGHMGMRKGEDRAAGTVEGRNYSIPDRKGARKPCGATSKQTKTKTKEFLILRVPGKHRLSPAHTKKVVLKQVVIIGKFGIPN